MYKNQNLQPKEKNIRNIEIVADAMSLLVSVKRHEFTYLGTSYVSTFTFSSKGLEVSSVNSSDKIENSHFVAISYKNKVVFKANIGDDCRISDVVNAPGKWQSVLKDLFFSNTLKLAQSSA